MKRRLYFLTLFVALALLNPVVIVGMSTPQETPSTTESSVSEVQSNEKDGTGTQNRISESLDKMTGQSEAPAVTGWHVSLQKIIWSVVVFLILLEAIKYLTKGLEIVAERWTNLRLFIKRLIPVLRILGWTFAVYIVIVWIIAPPLETIVAVVASAGIAVGFASQDILKNVFDGIIILFDQPFQVGDKVEIGDYYGEVSHIGLRTVRLVTPDDSLVSVPNSEIINKPVSNANSGEFNCQVVAEFYLPAHVDIAAVKSIAWRAASVSRYVYLKKPIRVMVSNEIHEGRSVLKMRLKAYVLDLRYEFHSRAK